MKNSSVSGDKIIESLTRCEFNIDDYLFKFQLDYLIGISYLLLMKKIYPRL